MNANLYKKEHYTSLFYRSFFSTIYSSFNLVLTGSERLKNNLINIISSDKIIVTGDSRLDRVLQRQVENTSSLLPDSFNKSHTLILGSLVPSDLPYIFGGFEIFYPNGMHSIEEKNHQIIIVPHEITQPILKEIETKLKKLQIEYIFYSRKSLFQNYQVIIIDEIGILADLYSYSDIAYVGAGFGKGVHSVLEPAVYYNAISFGPNFQIVDMAVSLINNNLASVIETAEDFSKFCSLMDDEPQLTKIRTNIKNYILNQPRAVKQITNQIFSHD
jgi:3-deoxy-D-manno-octulosonic-acid transferase